MDWAAAVIQRHDSDFDVLADTLSPPLELAMAEGEVEVVPHIPRHDDVREAYFAGGPHILEQQGVFFDGRLQFSGQHTDTHNNRWEGPTVHLSN